MFSVVYLFIKERIHFEGTATELVEQLKSVTDEEFFANRVTRDLVQNGYEMSKYGIDFKHKRTHSGRVICIDYHAERDGSDGKNGTQGNVEHLWASNPIIVKLTKMWDWHIAQTKLTAYAGIDPTVKQSGDFCIIKNHMLKRGSPYLRRALWQACVIAVQHDSMFKVYYEKKAAEGKRYMNIIGHCTRKMV